MVLLAGCDRLDSEGVYVPEPCDEQVPRQLHPSGGDDGAWVRGIVWADLACPDPSATLSLEQDGAPVPGAVEGTHSGYQVRFVPEDFLQPETTYDARLDTSSGFVAWQFRTSALGPAVGGDLNERALALFPARAGVLEPAGFQDELPRLLLYAVHPVVPFQGEPSGGGVQMSLGARRGDAVANEQDAGVEQLDFLGDWKDPRWRGGPFDLRFQADGWAFVLEDAGIGGAVAPGLAWGGGGALTGLWDVREASGGLSDEFASPCSTSMQSGGEGCVACRDGALACLPVDLRNIPAQAWGWLLP